MPAVIGYTNKPLCIPITHLAHNTRSASLTSNAASCACDASSACLRPSHSTAASASKTYTQSNTFVNLHTRLCGAKTSPCMAYCGPESLTVQLTAYCKRLSRMTTHKPHSLTCKHTHTHTHTPQCPRTVHPRCVHLRPCLPCVWRHPPSPPLSS